MRGRLVAPAVAGLVAGYLGMTLVVAAGVGALVVGTPGALAALTVIGGLYLVWLGIRTMAHPAGPIVADQGHRTAPRDTRGTLLRGMGVSGLNPKALLLFLALLPQFTSSRWDWPVAVQAGLLGLVFTLTCAAFYATMGLFARTVLHTRPVAARVVSRISGLGMVLVGSSLLAERLLR